jgi:hypothetical protein
MANRICFELCPRTNVGRDTTALIPEPSRSRNSVRVPHVRTSVRGPKTMGEAQQTSLSSNPLLCLAREDDASMAKRFANGYPLSPRWVCGPHRNRAKRIEYSLLALQSCGAERLPRKPLINPQPPFEQRLLLESIPSPKSSRPKRSAVD